jgi:hypothetical protein
LLVSSIIQKHHQLFIKCNYQNCIPGKLSILKGGLRCKKKGRCGCKNTPHSSPASPAKCIAVNTTPNAPINQSQTKSNCRAFSMVVLTRNHNQSTTRNPTAQPPPPLHLLLSIGSLLYRFKILTQVMSFRGIAALGRVVASRHRAPAQYGVRGLSTAMEIDSEYGVYGGWKVPYTVQPEVVHPSTDAVRSAYRVLQGDGVLVSGAVEPEMSQERAVELMQLMIRLETMDQVFYDAQRQGRMSFYMTSAGEEAITIGTSSALEPQDMVFAQYREAGVLMYRGFTLQNFADQCFSNADDKGKGRQMPVHYGTAELNYQTISSPLGTQLPQAVGAAYKYKLSGEDRIGACYFGEGAASEGEEH